MIEIKQRKTTDFQFIVKSKTGKTLLESIPFSDEETIKQTLGVLEKENAPMALFERKTNFEGKFLFNLKNLEGKIIGSSGLYSSEAGMENGIKNIKSSFQSNHK